MAIYHLTTKIVKRSQGQSAVAKAAYNAHDKLKNKDTGERHDYTRKGEVAFNGIFAPKNAPEWVQNREALWSNVEQRETRKNSQLAREIEIALPHELTDQQREWLVKDFVRKNLVRKSIIADVSIHAPSKEGDERNYHAHILTTMREINQDGFGEKMRHLNTKEQLYEWRENWSNLANRHLERHGHAARVDHRSLEAQGIDREPTIHIGPTATDFEREGVKTERGELNREIKKLNRVKKDYELLKEEEKSAIKESAPVASKQPSKEKKKTHQGRPTQQAPKGKALNDTADKMSGATSKAGDVAGRLTSAFMNKVGDCLEFFAASPAPKEYTPAELARDSAARREVQRRKMAAQERDETVDRWAEMMRERAGEYAALPASDVQHLNKADLENIKANGDDGIRAIIEQREQEREKERQRQRTRGGRERER